MTDQPNLQTSNNTLNSKRVMLVCACGCGLEFVPKRKDQRFAFSDHRIRFYKNTAHECPVCGIVHYGARIEHELWPLQQLD